MFTTKIIYPYPFDKDLRLDSFREHQDLYGIHVPGLTFLHALAGFIGYSTRRYPVFFVTIYHDRYELLLEKLRQAAIEQGCNLERLQAA